VFFVMILSVVFMVALLSYYLLFRTTEPVRKIYKDNVVVPDSSAKENGRKGYSWDKERDTLQDTGEVKPIQIKPVQPQEPDTSTMDLDTTVHF